MSRAGLRRQDVVLESPPRLAPCRIGGEEFGLAASGCAWHATSRSLLAADLHLEKGTSFAARGQMLPPYDTRETLRRLLAAFEIFRPDRLILLGDSFHSMHQAMAEQPDAVAIIAALAARAELIWIAGNHDPELPLALPGQASASVLIGDVVLRHLPVADDRAEIVGHLHPAAFLQTRAGRQKRRCFIHSGERLILPAFGTLTGSIDVADPMIARWFPEGRGMVDLLCRDRLQRLPLSSVV